MIVLERNSRRFTLRVAGVALDVTSGDVTSGDGASGDGASGARVLLQRASHEPFWTLPGGRAELGESSAEAVVRELHEEIGVAARVERPLWMVENFFCYEGRDCQELGIYYLVSFPENPEIYEKNAPFDAHEEGIVLVYEWHPIERLEEIDIKPSFLLDAIRGLAASGPETPADAFRHVVQRDAAI